ncbi:DNA polymerase III, alpha subunit [Asticcacaulis biprosthecium C19]|uniref:Error-prone DNA polymerase n=1 Tax=Asticcacaulis biprosthecium C19 TaxID=715226 RepID=F4QFZ4_9CAUL|nr:error-prone DNA polymerase [Asticcacaulis biprosthecium]EGF93805.1 DNA polymerase III, alpha subunit [Asticcacaulis biprosthecium C19]
MPDYVELQCASYFSFLRGCSAPDDLFAQAKALGMEALAIADRNTLAGIVRAHVAAKETGVRLIIGCRLDLTDGMSILVYPVDRAGYGRLCRLLSLGKSRGGKGACDLEWSDIEDFHEGLIAIFIPDEADELCAVRLRRFKQVFADRAYMALTLRHRQNDHMRLHELSNLAFKHRVPTVVTNDVLYHIHERAMLHDVVTCIRNRCTIDTMGDLRHRYADRFLKSPEEMGRLFSDYRQAMARTIEIADRSRFSLAELEYQYPEEKLMSGMSAIEALKRLSWAGAKWRYPEGVPDKVIKLLKHELDLIERLDYAPYFLTVNAIVQFARSKDILCQGRGSAANSCVCYVLGVTSVDPDRNDLLFERFISEERKEPPDIDVDFEHQRREEVMQWVFKTYGRNHAALTAVVTRFRTRGALRDTLKVLGFPEDTIKTLASSIRHWHSTGFSEEDAAELNLNTKDRRLKLAFEIHLLLLDVPRQLSQHPGGFVLTHDRLDELVPIEPARMKDRQVIEWDKDDIDAVKFMKVDCLALGMMSCMKRAFDLLGEHKGIHIDMSCIPPEDPKTYAMIRNADTIGTFQIESRAQMSMLPRTKPRTFYDLVIQVAIVRPGPIQGDMVHPYLRRLEGLEEVTFPTPELAAILGKTLGVPLFQEQAMRVVIVCAGFTAGQADLVRRAQATFKKTGGIGPLAQDIINGMKGNGYTEEFALTLVKQLEGFGSYGFPESHAFSFAIISEASAWMKCHHPDVFLAAILNSQPMGFYAPGQLIRDAKLHGVEVRWFCVNNSRWDCSLEPTERPGRFAVRLGYRLVKGIRSQEIAEMILRRGDLPYKSVPDLWRRAKTPVATLRKLARADVFEQAFKVSRREALFSIRALRDDALPLFDSLLDETGRSLSEIDQPDMDFKRMTDGAEVVEDYNQVGFTKGSHPVAFLRADLKERSIITCREAMTSKDKRYVQVAGMVNVRQRPGSANGVIFMTIEDESGDANIVVWEKVGLEYKRAVYGSSLVLITGFIQKEGDVVHLIARTVVDLSHMLASVGERDTPLQLPHQPGDELRNGGPGVDPRVVRQGRAQIQHRSRDFK